MDLVQLFHLFAIHLSSRLDDIVYAYFHERIRENEKLLAQEKNEKEKMFPVGEDDETIALQFKIIKVRILMILTL